MKKVYTKPVMESEEFVSNEYVAACWTITCTNSDGSCGKITGKDEYPSGLTINSSGYGIYEGKIGNSEGCREEIVENDYHINNFWSFLKWLWDYINDQTTHAEKFHPVEVKTGYEENGTFHPNASV